MKELAQVCLEKMQLHTSIILFPSYRSYKSVRSVIKNHFYSKNAVKSCYLRHVSGTAGSKSQVTTSALGAQGAWDHQALNISRFSLCTSDTALNPLLPCFSKQLCPWGAWPCETRPWFYHSHGHTAQASPQPHQQESAGMLQEDTFSNYSPGLHISQKCISAEVFVVSGKRS